MNNINNIYINVNKLIHRLEKALDIQWLGTLTQELHLGTPTTFPSPATTPPPPTGNFEAIFPLTFNICTYKIIATCIECASMLWANNTHVTHEYKAGQSMLCYSQLIN